MVDDFESLDEVSETTWNHVWSNRRGAASSDLTLEEAMQLDGMCEAGRSIPVSSWILYGKRVADRLRLQEQHQVFEVGCGAGAFLMSLREASGAQVAGLDLSAHLIDSARRFIDSGIFFAADAAVPLASNIWDVVAASTAVVSNSVVHYLPEISDVSRIISSFAREVPQVAILDVPDAATMSAAEDERARAFPPGEYAHQYRQSGLQHLYIHRDEMQDIARTHGLTVEIVQQDIKGYRQSRFRFNAFFRH